MFRKFLYFTLFSFSVLFISSCNKSNLLDEETDDDSDNVRVGVTHEEASDYVYDASSAISIVFNGTSITTSSSNVTVSGNTATITAGGTYSVSGSLTDGQLIVNASGAVVKIIMNGVTMVNSSTSPFYIKKSQKTILILADNTTNTVTDASSYASSDEPNAAIFSNCDMTIFGNGTLTVKGNSYDGIATDDGLIIKSGTINVTAADDAIRGKDYLIVRDGVITAKGSTGHALKSNNDTNKGYGFIDVEGGTFDLTSSSADGVHAVKRVIINGGTFSIAAAASQAFKADSSVIINDGTVNVTTSREGIESFVIKINGGSTNIIASNDGLNATAGTVSGGTESNDGSNIYINGGTVNLSVSSGDCIDSNGSVTMTGGTVSAHGPSSQPEVALDYNGSFNISGGTLIAVGPNSGTMIQGVSSGSSQYSVLAKFSSTLSSGTFVHLQDASGTDLITFKPSRAYYYVVFSSSMLKSGSTYYLYTGGTSTGTASNGVYTGGTYSGGTLRKTFTISNSVTSLSGI
ncbi:MAG: uncharacterized protein H6Q17_2665 [Bacteroidetes bacterium]|nr:uncharacterized protein [Bacteroidota bacterium]